MPTITLVRAAYQSQDPGLRWVPRLVLSGRMSTERCDRQAPWDGDAVIWGCKNYACYHQIFMASMPELNFRNLEVRAPRRTLRRPGSSWRGRLPPDASSVPPSIDDNNAIPLKPSTAPTPGGRVQRLRRKESSAAWRSDGPFDRREPLG